MLEAIQRVKNAENQADDYLYRCEERLRQMCQQFSQEKSQRWEEARKTSSAQREQQLQKAKQQAEALLSSAQAATEKECEHLNQQAQLQTSRAVHWLTERLVSRP